MKTIISVLTLSLLLSGNLMAQNTPAKKETKILELTGALSAGLVYNTYITIGATTDNHVKKTYADQKTLDILNEQKAILGAIKEVVDSVVESDELDDPNDVEFLKDLSRVLSGLSLQASYYVTYIGNKTDANINNYEKQRQKNWEMVSQMMGLDE
jgi:hypothetical protein